MADQSPKPPKKKLDIYTIVLIGIVGVVIFALPVAQSANPPKAETVAPTAVVTAPAVKETPTAAEPVTLVTPDSVSSATTAVWSAQIAASKSLEEDIKQLQTVEAYLGYLHTSMESTTLYLKRIRENMQVHQAEMTTPAKK